MNILPILLLIPFIAAQLTDDTSTPPLNITDTTIASAAFSYTGETGPLGWTGLDKVGNVKCSMGHSQSPINLDSGIRSVPHPSVTINNQPVKFTNNGHTVQAAARGTTAFNGKTYSLTQFHFHTPSEHRVSDEYYPLEVHFVHKATDGSLLVLGAFFEITSNGATTPFIQSLAKHVQEISKPNSATTVNGLVFGPLTSLWRNGLLFGYTGSLTTPPCSEGIQWIIARAPLPMDAASYLAFKKVLKFNARYTQNAPGKTNLIEMAASQMPT